MDLNTAVFMEDPGQTPEQRGRAMNHLVARWGSLFFMGAVLLSGHAIAADTLPLGGNGGTADWSLNCPLGKRVTGVLVRYSNVIHTIQLRCTGVAADGKWMPSSGGWTFETSSDSPVPFTKQEIAACNTDRFVAGFRVATKSIVTAAGPQLVLSSIVLACHKLNANEAFVDVANPQQYGIGAGAGGGTLTPGYLYCPTGGASKGAKGRRGWYLDSMALKCANPSAE